MKSMATEEETVPDAAEEVPAAPEEEAPEPEEPAAPEEPGGDGDDGERVTGTVKKYMNRSGYGFITPDVDPELEMWVHWREIHSDDSWPALEEGMKVEYTSKTVTEGRKAGKLYASHVTLLGGGKISVDARKLDGKTVVAGQDEKFTGVVKNWNMRKGWGFIKLDDAKIEIDEESIEEDIFFPREEINTKDLHPCVLPGTKVEFAIYKDEKGFGAAGVSLEGGDAISVDEEARLKAFPREQFFPNGPNQNRRNMMGRGGHRNQQQFMMVPMMNPMMQQMQMMQQMMNQGGRGMMGGQPQADPMQNQMDQMMAQMASLMNNQMPMMQQPQMRGGMGGMPGMGGMGGMGGMPGMFGGGMGGGPGRMGPGGPMGGQRRAPLVRETVDDSASTGVVIQWKGRFGWITATSDISGFPDAGRRGGRIYLHSKDLNGADELPVGAEVTFQLYKDKEGLGAKDVTQTGTYDGDVSALIPAHTGPRRPRQQMGGGMGGMGGMMGFPQMMNMMGGGGGGWNFGGGMGGGGGGGGYQRKPGDWPCAACGFDRNFASRDTCYKCSAAKGAAGASGGAAMPAAAPAAGGGVNMW